MNDETSDGYNDDTDDNVASNHPQLDEDVILAIQRGGTSTLSFDEAARRFYLLYFERLVKVGMQERLSCDRAEDIAQSLIEDLVLQKRLKNYKPGVFDAWICTCMRNRCRASFRPRKNRDWIELDDPEMERFLGSEDQLDEGADVEFFWKRLSQGKVLSPLEFCVFSIYIEEDEDIQRTAERLQESPKYVSRVLWKARKKLVAWLQQCKDLI